MRKTLVAAVAAATLLTPSLAAAPALAADNNTARTTVTVDQAKAKLAEVDQAIATLRDAQAATPRTDYAREIRELLDTAFELRTLITQLATGQVPTVDFATLETRVTLVREIASTIRVATTELRTKVVAAHEELGFSITKAVLRVANPTATEAQLQASLTELRDDLDRVRTYPDMGPNDVATIYVKVALTKEIWDTRIKRDQNILGKVPSPVYFELNRAITKAVGVELSPTSTVAQVNTQIETLQAAYAKAAAHTK